MFYWKILIEQGNHGNRSEIGEEICVDPSFLRAFIHSNSMWPKQEGRILKIIPSFHQS